MFIYSCFTKRGRFFGNYFTLLMTDSKTNRKKIMDNLIEMLMQMSNVNVLTRNQTLRL